MTAFTTSNIPSSVTTIEELHVWTASILAELYPTEQIQTDAATIESAVTANSFRFANQPTDKERFVSLAYLKLSPDWRGAGKIYGEAIEEFGSLAIPAHYLS